MALNCSQRSMLPSHTTEKAIRSPVSVVNGFGDNVSGKKEECFSGFWNASRGEDDRLDSEDIVDVLPSDPFGMDIKTTFSAITGWLEDLEVDYAERMKRNDGRKSREDYGLFGGWDFLLNSGLKLQAAPSYGQSAEEFSMDAQSSSSNFHGYRVCDDEKLNVESNCNFDRNMGDTVGFSGASTRFSSELKIVDGVNDAPSSGESPHEAFAFALSYLGVKDLLSVEQVCRPLCSTVRDDPLLWMSIDIGRPLNEKVTDDDVMKLVSRARGNLQCINLVDCHKLTDDGIKRIFESNSRLTKLSVPGCTRLTIESMVNNIKNYNSNRNVHGIKQLRIGGLYGIAQEHYEELTLLLGADRDKIKSQHKPHFYQRGKFYLPYDDGRVLDIDVCPICEKFRLVYDCPAGNCKGKEKGSIACRGCTLCIPRCAHCGRCVNDTEYEETFCLEFLCSGCYKQFNECPLKQDEKGDPCGAPDAVSRSFTLHG